MQLQVASRARHADSGATGVITTAIAKEACEYDDGVVC
jgi:hypothetical protein